MIVVAKACLVLMAGIYAIRATSVVFNPQPFEPLMLVAAFAFVMSVVIFYRGPTEVGPWLYTVVALSVIGVIANSMLFFAPDESHKDLTNLTFSALSIVGWAVIAFSYASIFLVRAK
jgi:hypothetical protein